MPRARDMVRRFWEKVLKTDGCWLWTASVNWNGYGRIMGAKRKLTSAHRLSYEINIGPIGKGLCVCHHCDNRKCVRPDHLFLGTVADNNRDMFAKGRHTRTYTPVTHCKHGHEFTAENTERRPNGSRACKECGRRKAKRYYWQRKTNGMSLSGPDTALMR